MEVVSSRELRLESRRSRYEDVVELPAEMPDVAALEIGLLLLAVVFDVVLTSSSSSDSSVEVSSSLLDSDSTLLLSAAAVLCCGKKRLTNGFFSVVAAAAVVLVVADGAAAGRVVRAGLSLVAEKRAADGALPAAAELAELSVEAVESLLPERVVFLTAATWAGTGAAGFDCWIGGVGDPSDSSSESLTA